MTAILMGCALVLLGTIAVGLWRIYYGPTPCDRMMSAQLFGTTGVAMLLILAEAVDMPAARDTALIFALLAAMAGVMFVYRPLGLIEPDDDPDTTPAAGREDG